MECKGDDVALFAYKALVAPRHGVVVIKVQDLKDADLNPGFKAVHVPRGKDSWKLYLINVAREFIKANVVSADATHVDLEFVADRSKPLEAYFKIK